MNNKYTLIYADPPWTYRDKAKDGERGAGHKYQTMNVLDICRLPVWELAAENCLLAMWWVPTQPLEALRVVEAWGFRLMTMKNLRAAPKEIRRLFSGAGYSKMPQVLAPALYAQVMLRHAIKRLSS